MLPDILTESWVQTFHPAHLNTIHGVFRFRFEKRRLVAVPRGVHLRDAIRKAEPGRKTARLIGQSPAWKPRPWSSSIRAASAWSERLEWGSLANHMKCGRWAVPQEHSLEIVWDSVGDVPLQTPLETAMYHTWLRSWNFACSFRTLQCGISQWWVNIVYMLLINGLYCTCYL